MKLLLSCISTKHSTLKKHWTETNRGSHGVQGRSDTSCPLTVLGSHQKPQEDLGGLLCLIEDMGLSRTTFDLSMAAGMVRSEKGVMVTSFGSVHEIDTHTGVVHRDIVSLPVFNALHSISRTRRGYLVASTGVDLLVEFNREGDVLWNWWATEHGFEHTPTGERRLLDKTVDQRTMKYGTLGQTTHVNSAAELPGGKTILATLFHQGTVIGIDRETGTWHTVLEGLDHPHAVRILDEEYFTVADTVHGRALLVRIQNGTGQVVESIDAGTT